MLGREPVNGIEGYKDEKEKKEDGNLMAAGDDLRDMVAKDESHIFY